MSDDEALSHYLRYLDRLTELVDQREQPAYSETCTCGASVTVAKGVSRPDLRSIHVNFLGRHRACVGLPPTSHPKDHQPGTRPEGTRL